MESQNGITLIKLILIIVAGIAVVYGIAFLLYSNYDFPESEPSKYERICNIGETITTPKYEITVKKIYMNILGDTALIKIK